MKFKRITAILILICILCSMFGRNSYAASSGSYGYNIGKDPSSLTVGKLKSNFTGDFEIIENMTFKIDTSDGNSLSAIQSLVNGSSYGTYNTYSPVVSGYLNDQQLWVVMTKLSNSAAKKTFDKVFIDGNGFQNACKKAFKDVSNVKTDKDTVKGFIEAKGGGKSKSPLNMLRLLQMYLITRDGNSKTYIGGWPVQVTGKNCNGDLEGVRTIDEVYKAFTGCKWNNTTKGNASKKVKTSGTGKNCKSGSICDKLANGTGDYTFHQAAIDLKNAIKKTNVAIYEGEEMLTGGNMTYEEYFVRSIRDESALLGSQSEEITPEDLESKDYNYKVVGPVPKDISDKINELKSGTNTIHDNNSFSACVFRYLAEYGIVFNSPKDVDDDTTNTKKTIFKDNANKDYYDIHYVVYKNNKVKTENLSSEVISNDIAGVLKGLITGKNGPLSGSNKQDRMYDICKRIIEACGGEGEDFKNYIKLNGSNVGESFGELLTSKKDENLAAEIDNSKKKTANGINNLNKITKRYVVQFFLECATNAGNTGNQVVDDEYAKIIRLLESETVVNGTAGVSTYYSMLYSMQKIKEEENSKYTKTFNARNNQQINAVMSFCENNMKRIYRFYNGVKSNNQGEDISFGRNPDYKEGGNNSNVIQYYSDWCQAYSSICSLCTDVLVAQGKPNDAGTYSSVSSDFKKWLKSKHNGMTRYEDGVQHQDGFVPYGLNKDKEEVKESTKKFFEIKENSEDGKNTFKTYNSNSQSKVLKWIITEEDLQKELQEHLWLELVNAFIVIVGYLMFFITFILVTAHVADEVSGNKYNFTEKITFGRATFPLEKRDRRLVKLKFVVVIVISIFMLTGDLILWGLNITNLVSQAITPK